MTHPTKKAKLKPGDRARMLMGKQPEVTIIRYHKYNPNWVRVQRREGCQLETIHINLLAIVRPK